MVTLLSQIGGTFAFPDVRESGDRLGLITRRRQVRVLARSCRHGRARRRFIPQKASVAPSSPTANGRGIRSIPGLIGIDGSARQQRSSRSQRTALAQPGNRKCERQRSHRDGRVHRGGPRAARGVRELERPGRRVTAPTRRTARRDELTRAGKDGALVEAAHAAPYAGRRHCCTTRSDAGSIPASSTPFSA